MHVIGTLLRRALAVTGRRPGAPAPARGAAPAPTLDASLAAAGLSLEQWLRAGDASRPALYGCLRAGAAATLRRRLPEQHERVLRAAAEVLEHRFDLLGSGPFQPRDPERPERDGYAPIDWYLDPVRGLRFPRGVHHRDWDYLAMRPGNADVKYPWELGRCQGWVTLGQAWQLTGDERYAREIADQLTDFLEANPVGVGVNWTCTMDVAIRAASWAIALGQVRGCERLDEDFRATAYRSLFDHGAFIRGNLENTYEVTSNHFLSNVVGLYFVAAVFDGLAIGREWAAFARTSLEAEIVAQVCEDGSDYESSVPYHRLVTELFLGAARLAALRGEPLSQPYGQRLQRMVGFLLGVTRPDGLMPQVGDADDGRLHVMDGIGHWRPQDARHLLGPAAWQFEREDWQALAGADALWEAEWWGFDTGGRAAAPPGLPEHHALYPDAGIAVSREGGSYLLVTNGRVGTAGFGNHKHNDLLGFEYHAGGHAWVVDPGSYVYTSDFDARNALRSIAAHSTLQVDGQECNEFRAEWLFRMFERAQPEHIAFEVGADAVEYRGRHGGFRRGEDVVTHTRALRLLRASGALCIADRIDGPAGEHALAWRLQLAPGVTVEALDVAAAELAQGGARLRVEGPDGARASVEEGAYSPGYGVRTAAPRLLFEATGGAGAVFGMALIPHGVAADGTRAVRAALVSELGQ